MKINKLITKYNHNAADSKDWYFEDATVQAATCALVGTGGTGASAIL